MKLIKPNKNYLNSYFEACVESREHVHDSYIIHDPKKFDDWKDKIFQQYEKEEKGINLPENIVPSITFWLTDNLKYIGTVNIRPNLNKRLEEYGGHIGFMIRAKYRNQGYGSLIAKLGIIKAKELGIKNILMTCETSNKISDTILTNLNPYKIENDNVLLYGSIKPIKRFFYK